MYRGYSRETYLKQLAKLRNACDDVAVSSDIIVGFCGETDEDFQATIDLLEEVRYDFIYSFVYSPRPKTTAALYFKDDVPDEIKQERLRKVQEVQSQISLQNNQEQVGKTFHILVEGPSKFGDTCFGRSSQNHIVHFEGEEGDVERFVEVKIVRARPNSLVGEKV
jgi:tRNA-2-methylthio-N6-dimethylallyladenosine synthase